MNARRHPRLRMWALAMLMICWIPAHAASVTWTVDRGGDDASNGDAASHVGSLRFVLARAASGDHVAFADVEAIFINSPLVVPPGVSVGRTRSEDCGSYTTPLVNLKDPTLTINPMLSLGADATLRNLNLAGGDVELVVQGDDVDVCAVGLGIEYDGDGFPIPLHPKHAALIIRGARTVVHRSDLLGPVIVDVGGSDSRLGDTLEGTGESNAGVRNASITVLASASSAARRVTVRDPFPRGLHGMLNGTFGGDDWPNHANNWAQRPVIMQAHAVTSATLIISGSANPLSLVDIYLDNQLDVVRQTPVVADANGHFTFTGSLPAGSVTAIAASTLNDPAYPSRVGSSSPWSDAVTVATNLNAPTISVAASLDNISYPGVSPANPGNVLRFTIHVVNSGTITVSTVTTSNPFTSANMQVVIGSGSITGNGVGMAATDTGFSVSSLPPGAGVSFSLDAAVQPLAAPAQSTFRLTVNAQSVNSRLMQQSYAVAPLPRVLLPLIPHN